MFDLFKKEVLQKSHLPENLSIAKVVLSMAAVMLVGSFIQSFLILPFVISDLDSVDAIESVLSSEKVMLIHLYLTVVISLLLVYVAVKFHKRSLFSLGLTKKNAVRHYILGHFVGWLTLSGALFLTCLLGGADFVGIDLQNPLFILLFFFGFVLQGFEEELMCRGFVMFGLSKSHSIFFSMMLNSLLFAGLHLGNPGVNFLSMINLFLAGFSFSCMAVYFDDIWVASGAHSMWNFAQGNLYGILVSGMNMGASVFQFELKEGIFGGSFGLEGGIGVMLVEVVTILVFCLLYSKKMNKKEA